MRLRYGQIQGFEAARGRMMRTREEQIAERREQIPKLYRSIYDRAIKGKSRKAAMHAFCLECCGGQIKEVHACSDTGCSLYPYRPKPRASQGMPESVSDEQKLKNSENKGIG